MYRQLGAWRTVRRITTTPVASGNSLLTNLVAWWTFNDVLTDSSGNGYTLTQDSVSGGYVAGKQGSAKNVNPSAAGCLYNTSLSQTGSFTIAGWFQFDAVGAAYLVDTYSAGNRGFYLQLNTSYPRIAVEATDATFLDSWWGSAVTTATWYHIAAWFDNTIGRVSISVNNGTAINTDDSALIGKSLHSAARTSLSGRYTGATYDNLLDGKIDELGIWSRVLTSGERTSLYNSGNGIGYGSL